MSFRTKFGLILLSATLALYTVVGGWISTRAQRFVPALCEDWRTASILIPRI